MKTFLTSLAAVFALAVPTVQSQAPAPAAPTPAPSAQQLLQQVRDANVKLLEQQARTLQLLDEMEKTSQTIKTLGKRA